MDGMGRCVYFEPLTGDTSRDNRLSIPLEFCKRRDPPEHSRLFGMVDFLVKKVCVSSDPLSNQPVEIARNWLKKCSSSHPACSERPLDTIPSRLVDLGDDTDIDIEEVRLIETSKVSDLIIKYATLSHCWGRVERTTTKECNVASMKQGIKISELSPTFLDAIKVAKLLKIRYIWIDSICIIQDSIEDWTRESTKMAGIFANSFLTIAGPSSTNSQEGFLSPRLNGKYFVQFDEPLSGLYMRKRLGGFSEEIQESPLHDRAWVFQETQLSRRLLYYSKEQMFWKCRQGCAQEDFDDGYDMGDAPESRTLFDGQQSIIESKMKISPEDYEKSPLVRSNWYSLLDEYSQKVSTYQTDKLPALSAIAQEIQRLTGHTYLAGLWKEDLITGLLWQRKLVDDRIQGAVEPRALTLIEEASTPSWSWAAYDGYQQSCEHWEFYNIGAGDLATIKHASVEMVDKNYPTGRVKGGIIEVVGPCQNLFHKKDIVTLLPVNFNGNQWKNLKRVVVFESKWRVDINFDLAKERESNEPAVCLALRDFEPETIYSNVRSWEESSKTYCLVLRFCDSGRYRRVGVAVAWSAGRKDIDISWKRRNLTIV